ncbi:DUF5693 family protein [Halobacillus trueperi]|uniref:DUF5693 family protein n=1 Tax=Halobacillus trueperi TaxID=156205 RepID=UPI0037355BA6
MKQKKVWWLIIIGLLLLSIPSVIERWSIEWTQNEYEIILTDDRLAQMLEIGNEEDMIETLRDAGLSGVLFSSRSIDENQPLIDKVREADLEVILSYFNDGSSKDLEQWQSIEDTYEDDEDYLHIASKNVPGYPDEEKMDLYAELLEEGNDGIYLTEFKTYRGVSYFSEQLNHNVVRLHDLGSMHGKQTLEEKVDRTLRAVKERNQRSILMTSEEMASFDFTLEYIKQVHEKMPSKFSLGEANGIPSFGPSFFQILTALIAGIIYTYMALSSTFENKKWKWLTALPILIALGYIVTQKLILLQGFALIIAIAAPIFALRATAFGTKAIKSIALKFLKALVITSIGILIVISLLNGTVFLAGIELFRGVKLLYVVPLLFFTIAALWGISLKEVIRETKWWHYLLFGVFGLFALYYVLRSGNGNFVPEWELAFRNKLEEWLYARPRTKEFLIGIPAYLLSFFVMADHKKIGKFLLIPGVIGFMSIVNTFTHLHIPLYLSLLRTGYSIVFGFLIGMICIKIYSLAVRK